MKADARRRTGLAALALLAGALAARPAAAAGKTAGPRVIEAGQTLRGPLVERNRDVVIRGRVVGDVRLTGGSVSVASSGVVTGAIQVAGGDVALASGARVRGPVRLAGRPALPRRAAAAEPVRPAAPL